jgi:hypothetical protein
MDNATTPIYLAVGYRAESTSNTTNDFVTELENALVDTAVMAILGCEANTTDLVFPTTLVVGKCRIRTGGEIIILYGKVQAACTVQRFSCPN